MLDLILHLVFRPGSLCRLSFHDVLDSGTTSQTRKEKTDTPAFTSRSSIVNKACMSLEFDISALAPFRFRGRNEALKSQYKRIIPIHSKKSRQSESSTVMEDSTEL
ncbi:hypothetical protein AVEN_145052-1 [Araneus ventricosus]|uniref:Uncharacterized protein n=1 Tax=Araneus ventricosus TaxID=182803 RepID=A0A4Y2WFQ0_ARAVE|nr:hypothetical protein AVEN_145052-1 [Araneus ventricosus]